MGNTYFKNEDMMIDFLTKMDETDIRSVNYIDEARLRLISDECPAFDTATVASVFGIPETDGDAIGEAVETTGVVWSGPVNGTMRSVPVSQVAMASLCGRAGLYGPSVKMKPTILNEGFALHSRTDENRAKTLVRNGLLLASHSSRYEWLPQGELARINRTVFTELFGKYRFREGQYTDEITYAVYEFPEQAGKLTAQYCKKAGGNMQVMPAVMFSTSDVTRSGANLYPVMVRSDGLRARLGKSLMLPHSQRHSVSDYADNCYQVLSMLQESAGQMEKLCDIKLLYPENAFQNAVKKFSLPVGAAGQAFEDFCIRRAAEVTASDLYWELWNITSYAGSSTPSKMLDLEEQLAKVIHTDWKKLDTPITA